ncbi:MAG: hypothetical protein ACREM9_01195, partial [Gemmatimonadales bacterium]
ERVFLRRGVLVGALGIGLALVTGLIWLLPGSNWRATTEALAALADGAAPVGGEADSGLTREARASTPSRQDGARSGRADRSPAPKALEKPRSREADPREPPDVLGYVAQPAASPEPDDPPETTGATGTPPARPTPPPTASAKPRPRAELERHQALRLSIGDVLRLRLVERIAEISPGVLLVSLTPTAMDAPNVMYHLQRLYLAYSAATKHPGGASLELRHGRELYGWFTRNGLRQASADTR